MVTEGKYNFLGVKDTRDYDNLLDTLADKKQEMMDKKAYSESNPPKLPPNSINLKTPLSYKIVGFRKKDGSFYKEGVASFTYGKAEEQADGEYKFSFLSQEDFDSMIEISRKVFDEYEKNNP
jgi:hypothetical protein